MVVFQMSSVLVVQWNLKFWTQKPPNWNPENHLKQTSMFGFKLSIFLDFLSSLLPILKAEVEGNSMSLKAKNKVHRRKSKGDFQACPIHESFGKPHPIWQNQPLPSRSFTGNAPEKLPSNPIGKDRLALPSFFRGELVQLPGGRGKKWVVFT